jgi:hypothetical protein
MDATFSLSGRRLDIDELRRRTLLLQIEHVERILGMSVRSCTYVRAVVDPDTVGLCRSGRRHAHVIATARRIGVRRHTESESR